MQAQIHAPRTGYAYNLLDNSDFEIAQAGYGGYHGSTIYAADRWGQNDSTVRTYEKVTRNGHGALKCNAATRIQQKLFLVDGQAYTGAFYINDKLCLHAFTANSGSYGSNEIWINHQSDGTYMFVITNIPAGGVVSEPVLYPGSYTADTLPPWVAPDPVLELTKCRTYFQQFDALPQKNGYKFGVGMSNAAANAVYFPILLSPPMRAGGPPTIIIDDDGLNLYNGNFFGVSTLYVYDYDSNDAGVGLIDVGCAPANNDITGKSTYMIILKPGKSLRISRDL